MTSTLPEDFSSFNPGARGRDASFNGDAMLLQPINEEDDEDNLLGKRNTGERGDDMLAKNHRHDAVSVSSSKASKGSRFGKFGGRVKNRLFRKNSNDSDEAEDFE